VSVLNVWTAPLAYKGADRLNVARRDNDDGTGLVFAPSETILSPILALRGLHAGLREKDVGREYLKSIWVNTWILYREAYRHEMRQSFRRHERVWKELLKKPVVTLVCFCPTPAYCHRTVLAQILGMMKARVCGERGNENAKGAA
jgi:hypothetical protein